MTTPSQKKANVLLLGGGAVGAIAALNIETSGLASVTAVLRSNYSIVSTNGYTIKSVDHGYLESWKPSKVLNTVPNVLKENLPPYDYLVLTTKNCPDIPPSLSSLIAPAVTPGHTIIVMIQNGLNIERPLFAAFPTNVILSGVSMIDAHESAPGHITHEEHDTLYIGAFQNPNSHLSPSSPTLESLTAASEKFIHIYNHAPFSTVHHTPNVPLSRWRKLIFNAVLNPLCAILHLDDARMRLTGSAVEGLVRPAMREIYLTARKLGVELEEDVIETMIHCDPLDLYLKPSMQVDLEKGNFLEFENLVGEPVREAEKVGVETPVLRVVYEMCKALQWRIKEERGFVNVPPKRVV